MSASSSVAVWPKVKRWLYNLLHILARAFVLALLAAYTHFYIMLVLAVMVAANYVLAR